MSMQSIRSGSWFHLGSCRLRGRRGCGSFVTDERNYLPPGRVMSSIDHREGGVWIGWTYRSTQSRPVRHTDQQIEELLHT